MFQLLLFLLLLIHWIACGWYIIISGEEGDNKWVPPKDLDKVPRQEGKLDTKTDFYEKEIIERYITVFYYSILTMVGNEIAPRTPG